MIVVNEEDVLLICQKIRKEIKNYNLYLNRIKGKCDLDDYWNKKKKNSWKRVAKIENLLWELGLGYNVVNLAFFGCARSLKYFKTGEADLFLVMHLNGELKYRKRASIWES